MTDLYYAGYADALRYALRILDRDGRPSSAIRRYIIDEIASAERCASLLERRGIYTHTYCDTPIPAREGSE